MLQMMWFMLNICFPSGSLEFWYTSDGECLCDQQPNTNLKYWVSNELASWLNNSSHMLSQLVAEGIKPILCDSVVKDSWKFATGFLCTLPHVLFPFLICFATFHCNKLWPWKRCFSVVWIFLTNYKQMAF